MSGKKLTLSRRGALRLIATTAASVPVFGCSERVVNEADTLTSVPTQAQPLSRSATDPDLNNPTVHWEFVLDEFELTTLASLCDMIIPADEFSPSASSLGAHHYINEHVSAPYDNNKADLVMVRGGIVWLNSESSRRFNKTFVELNAQQQTDICDDIQWEKTAKPQYRMGARFFEKIRNLTATAFYTTEQGMADIGYVGNKPSVNFDGPPAEVLSRLGLEQ